MRSTSQDLFFRCCVYCGPGHCYHHESKREVIVSYSSSGDVLATENVGIFVYVACLSHVLIAQFN